MRFEVEDITDRGTDLVFQQGGQGVAHSSNSHGLKRSYEHGEE